MILKKILFQRISESVKRRERGKFSAENYSGDEKVFFENNFEITLESLLVRDILLAVARKIPRPCLATVSGETVDRSGSQRVLK